MDDTSTDATPLTDRAVARLRKLAEGNALTPDAIKLVGTEERIYTLQGKITLEPTIETEAKSSAGPARGKAAQTYQNFQMLKHGVGEYSQRLKAQPDWVPEAVAQLKAEPGEGWGFHEAVITLPKPPKVILAANEQCPKCRGQKTIVCETCRGSGTAPCTTCGGQRYELCYNCRGFGTNPNNPKEPCMICSVSGIPSVVINGMKHIPCRTCNNTGMMTCPNCRGTRGLVCTPCQGTGAVSQEVTLTLTAKAKFDLKSDGIPSGMRRSLERLGVVNLSKGHADIITLVPEVEDSSENYEDDMGLAPLPDIPLPDDPENDDIPMPQHAPATHKQVAARPEVAKPEILYEAKIPYAEMRMDFAGRKANVGVFGKKSILVSVPSFLDTALQPSRQALKNMADGKAGNIEVLKATRALREALALQLAGKGTVQELRRFYPSGLSSAASTEILLNMRRALHRMTQTIRIGGAVAGGILSGALFAGYFLTPFHTALEGIGPKGAIDMVVLVLALGLSWFGLSSATSLALKRRFAGMTVPLKQKIGQTGFMMLGAIVVLFVLAALLAPHKPPWLASLLH